MLDRCVLNGVAAVVCAADARNGRRVTLWNMPEARRAIDGTVAYLSTDKSKATPNYGTPLPPNGIPFTIWLEPGEALWAVALNEALLGVSVAPTE